VESDIAKPDPKIFVMEVILKENRRNDRRNS
jgi:hypothetical protein